jgi:hypothetical protein
MKKLLTLLMAVAATLVIVPGPESVKVVESSGC